MLFFPVTFKGLRCVASTRSRKIIVGIGAACAVGALCAITAWSFLSPVTFASGPGSFFQVEYVLHFRDVQGKPVEGIRLKVEDGEGNDSYAYPVTDCLPDTSLLSNREGDLVFHHVSNGTEFTISWEESRSNPKIRPRRWAPVYVCRFYYADREVYRVEFAQLNGEFHRSIGIGLSVDELPKVRRKWTWTRTMLQYYPSHLQGSKSFKEEIDFPIYKKSVFVQDGRPAG
jgi:hypothetical protein